MAKRKLFLTYLSTIFLHDSTAILLRSWHGICIDSVVSRCYSTSYGKPPRDFFPKSLVFSYLRKLISQLR